MSELNFGLLKRTLRFDVALSWFGEDSTDDFFPDVIGYADIISNPEAYISRRDHKLLSYEAVPFLREYVPKKNLMLREALYLYPQHRLIYLAVLRHLIPKLDHRFLHGVYSYRSDQQDNPDKYPFGKKMHRWKDFHNDFRMAALDEKATGAVLLTDLSSFYDHISCEQLCLRIRSLLGASITHEDEQVIELLLRLLKLWSNDGYGIPQNMDPSNLFGSLYLHNIDEEMVGGRYRYYRWVDDIRIAAKNRDQAIRSLHTLQKACEKHRLYLASDKTEILTRDDPRFTRILDVKDDAILSEVEELVMSGNCEKLLASIDMLFERLNFHSGPEGDDRKFRAFANRILDASDFSPVKSVALSRLVGFVIPRLESHLERTDQWAKMLSAAAILPEVSAAIERHLVDSPSIFDWQRFHLWKLALFLPAPVSGRLLEKALEVSSSNLSEAVAAQAIVFVGKYCSNSQRETMFLDHFKSHRSYVVQRSILIAIQELPVPVRARFYARALDISAEHTELIAYLQAMSAPFYGNRLRSERICRSEVSTVDARILRGVGLVDGQTKRFRLSYSDFSYE